jgi:hypothetical protein
MTIDIKEFSACQSVELLVAFSVSESRRLGGVKGQAWSRRRFPPLFDVEYQEIEGSLGSPE